MKKLISFIFALVVAVHGFAQQTDVLTVTSLGITDTTFTDVSFASGAKYSGVVYDKSSIRFASNKKNGIYNTASGGKIKSITIKWNSQTNTKAAVSIYLSNEPFSSVDALFAGLSATTTCKYNQTAQTINIDGDYQYFGIRRNASYAIYIESISVVWDNGISDNSLSFSTGSCTFKDKFYLTLSLSSSGSIYYTTDGTDPTTENGNVYDSPINVDRTMTVKACVKNEDGTFGQTLSNTYTLELPAPTFSKSSQTFSKPFYVELNSNATAAEDILYTTDGSDVDVSKIGEGVYRYSEVSSSGIYVDNTATIKAASLSYDGQTLSDGATCTYTYAAADYFVKTSSLTDDKLYVFAGVKDNKTYMLTNENYVASSNKKVKADCLSETLGDYVRASKSEYIYRAIKADDENFYLYNELSGCYLTYSSTTNLTLETKTSDAAKWYVQDAMIYSKSASERLIGLNVNSNGDVYYFGSYSGGQTPAQIYEQAPTGTFSISSAKFGTLYVDHAFIMPDGADGYIVTTTEENKAIIDNKYPSGTLVPAKSAIVIAGEEDKYTYSIVPSTEEPVADNKLHGTLADEETSVDGNVKYYKLTVHDGELGFFWGAENGGPFTNKANKAYLAVEQSVLSTGASLESLFAVTNVNNAEAHCDKPAKVYDIYGRKVSNRPAAKGIYIINGKKCIIK